MNPADTLPERTIKRVTFQTTVCTVLGQPPYTIGNCFSALCDDGETYHILNMVLENFRHLGIENAAVLILEPGYAVMHDARIPEKFYRQAFCESCTPRRLLPITQRLKQLRDVHRGTRIEKGSRVIETFREA